MMDLPGLPCLAAMGGLLLASGFFSGSEAALFYLREPQRRQFVAGSRAQRLAAALLAAPQRLLTAILFANLMVNVAYFTLASIIGFGLDAEGKTAQAGAFAAVALLVLIVFGEMLPKSLAVMQARRLAVVAAVPLAAIVRLLGPVFGVFDVVVLLSRRLLLPGFQAEPYLRVSDLERAVQFSVSDAATAQHERQVLESLVSLADMRCDELMRPRRLMVAHRPPVALADLGGRLPPGGYLLVTEPDSDEVAGAVALGQLVEVPEQHLETLAEPVIYVPWSTTVAETLEAMRSRRRQVAAVVNEFGETVGVLSFEDIIDAVFSSAPSRSERLYQRTPIRMAAPGVWHVSGTTTLRRLARHFGLALPPSKSITVAGVVQEQLERLPETGDQCQWGPFRLRVLDVPERGLPLVELTLAPAQEQPS